jgi:RNA polymerase sigma-70 factor (ECF subfamily)
MVFPVPPPPGLQPEPSDPLAACVARAAGQDERALRELYDELSPRVLGIAQQILHDRSAAEDVVVEVFSQVWRQADRYDPTKGTVPTWVGTMARTRAIDVRRRMQRHTRRESALEADDVRAILDPADSPWVAACDADRGQIVRRALDRLPREQRRALEAAFFGGLSHTEIADVLGAPLGTVKTRIRSGLCALRLALGSFEGELA